MRKILDMIPARRLTRGVEVFHVHRFSVTTKNWRSKPNPYFFKTTYSDGTKTLQIMKFEYWYRPHMAKKNRKLR